MESFPPIALLGETATPYLPKFKGEIDMVTDIFRQVALNLLVHGVQTGNSTIIEAYWDLMYIYKFGLWKIPEIRIPPGHGPDPSPILSTQDHNFLLFELVNSVAGDPEPQPNLKTNVFSNKVRLAAVKGLRERLASAVKLADVEITRLTR
jgi:hypothetical protein